MFDKSQKLQRSHTKIVRLSSPSGSDPVLPLRHLVFKPPSPSVAQTCGLASSPTPNPTDLTRPFLRSAIRCGLHDLPVDVAQAQEDLREAAGLAEPEPAGGAKGLLRRILRNPPLVLTSMCLFLYSVALNSIFSTVVEDSGLGSESGGELLTLQSILYICCGPVAGEPRLPRPSPSPIPIPISCIRGRWD